MLGVHGRLQRAAPVNRDEIENWRWVGPEVLQAKMSSTDRSKFTPWLLLEWQRVWRDHRATVLALQPRKGPS